MRCVGAFSSRTERESRIPKLASGHGSKFSCGMRLATKKSRISVGVHLRNGEPFSRKGLIQISGGSGFGMHASLKLVEVRIVGSEVPSSDSVSRFVVTVKSWRSYKVPVLSGKLPDAIVDYVCTSSDIAAVQKIGILCVSRSISVVIVILTRQCIGQAVMCVLINNTRYSRPSVSFMRALLAYLYS